MVTGGTSSPYTFKLSHDGNLNLQSSAKSRLRSRICRCRSLDFSFATRFLTVVEGGPPCAGNRQAALVFLPCVGALEAQNNIRAGHAVFTGDQMCGGVPLNKCSAGIGIVRPPVLRAGRVGPGPADRAWAGELNEHVPVFPLTKKDLISVRSPIQLNPVSGMIFNSDWLLYFHNHSHRLLVDVAVHWGEFSTL